MQNETTTEKPQTQKRSLFDVVQAVRALFQRIDEAEGEVTPEDDAELDALTSSLEERGEAYAAVYRVLTEEAEACERMAQPYLDRAKSKLARAQRLKDRMREAMEACGKQKIVTPTATIAIQKSAPSLELLVPEHEAEQHIPETYLERVVKIRKDAIKAALQGGANLPFAQLKQGTHLRFR